MTKRYSFFVELGRDNGRGADSLIVAGMQAALDVKFGKFTKADAKPAFAAFMFGSNDERAYAEKLEADKSATSRWGTFFLPNVLKFGDIHERALKVRAAMVKRGEKPTLSAYNLLVKVNREQNKASALLSEAAIKAFMVKAEAEGEGEGEGSEGEEDAPKEKSLTERLGELAALARKINETFQPAGFETVLAMIEGYSPAAPVDNVVPMTKAA